MPNTIESDQLYIKDLFDNRWYCVPTYQRPYVWEDDQVSELLGDVTQALENSPQSDYFLGSMVLQRKQSEVDKVKFEEYDVLDGQQRLTTLLLILAVLRDVSIDRNKLLADTCANAIFQEKTSLKESRRELE